MSMMQEFKDFALKGNVMDLAVGVIIGGAFGKITTSLVEDIIMPIVGAIFGGFDFSNMFIILGKAPEGVDTNSYTALKEAGVAMLAYGNFITILINFIILAFIVFMLVKGMNKLRKDAEAAPAPEPAPAEPSEEVLLLREISQKLSK